MKRLTLGLLLSCLFVFPAMASLGDDAIEIMFSQEIVAIDSAGVAYEPTIIRPQEMPGMSSQDFDLGGERKLRVVSNLPENHQAGLRRVAQIVQRSYDFIELMTGGTLDKGVLLYLLEFEKIPVAYRFEAIYPATSPWQEVRVVLLNRGGTLLGTAGSMELAELLYDTLPHELGHDVLAGISPLLHDIDGEPSHYTRWFIEGVCELLAKQFAQAEAPEALPRFLAMRNVDDVLNQAAVREAVFSWAQHNDHSMSLESDLYGAAMLVLMAWTESVELKELLARINQCSSPLCGFDLELLMETSTGLSRQEVLARARQIGEALDRSNYLAKRIGLQAGEG